MTLYYFHYFEITAVITGAVVVRSLIQSSMFWLWLLALCGASVDLASSWAVQAGLPSNYFIFNLYTISAAPLIYWGYYQHLNLSKRNALLYKIGATVVSISFILNYALISGPNKVHTISIIFFYFSNVILTSGLLFKMAMEDRVFKFSDQPIFWTSTALLIFSLGALVTLGMHQFILINKLTIQNKALYRIIMPVLNVILYSSFTYSFLLCKLKKKSYLRLS